METKTEKTPNYTEEQEQVIRDAAPLNLEKATEIANAIGKTPRSVIAKAKSLDVEYIVKPAPLKKPKGVTKANLVEAIEGKTTVKLDGLEKATMGALQKLCGALSITVKASAD